MPIRLVIVPFLVLALASGVLASSCASRSEALAPPGPSGRKVTRTASFAGEVERLDGLEAAAQQIAQDVGGFVSASLRAGDEDDSSLSLTLQVPDAALPAALERLEALATHVEARRITADDVTTEVTDLESQRRNLSAARERLVALLEKAATATEALDVNRALTEVQGQLEQVEGRLSQLNQRVAMASISVSYTPRATAGFSSWRPLEVAAASAAALGMVARGLANLLIVTFVFSPLWAPPLLLVWRRRRARVAA